MTDETHIADELPKLAKLHSEGMLTDAEFKELKGRLIEKLVGVASAHNTVGMPVTELSDTKNCPFCGEQILAAAIKCKHCESDLGEKTSGAGQIERAQQTEPPNLQGMRSAVNQEERGFPYTKVGMGIAVAALLVGGSWLAYYFSHGAKTVTQTQQASSVSPSTNTTQNIPRAKLQSQPEANQSKAQAPADRAVASIPPPEKQTPTSPQAEAPTPAEPAVTFQPSFDCNRASTSTERRICSNKELAELDVQMTSNYRNALSSFADQTPLRDDQKRWLMLRNRCADMGCLVSAYNERIEELARWANSGASK